MASKCRGFVHFVSDDETYAHISQVEPIDGSPSLESSDNKGIYLSKNDCRSPLRTGMEIVFLAEADEERDGCFRARYARETSESRLRGMTEGGVQIAPLDDEIADANIFVSWCLSPAIAEKMKCKLLDKQEVRLLLISVRLTGNDKKPIADESRQLVELDAGAGLLSFRSSGKHRVIAAIVSGKRLEDQWLARNGGRYDTTLVSERGDSLLAVGYDLLGTGCIDVNIPEETFATKPRDFAWVNAYYK